MISEPATTLTDYVMAAVAVFFAVDLRRRAVDSEASRSWSLAFAFLAASALTGGTFHGFQGAIPSWLADVVWRASLASAALCSFATMRALALQWLSRNRANRSMHVASIKLLASLVAGGVYPEFMVVVLDFGLTLSFGLAAAILGRSRDSRALAFLCAGIGLFVLGAVIQQAHVSPHPAFNHNDLFHSIQILGNACFFLSARRG